MAAVSDAYIESKASVAARVLGSKGIDREEAQRLARALWREARSCILMTAGPQWHRMSAGDKAAVCGLVVKALLDKKRLGAFLSGERKSLL